MNHTSFSTLSWKELESLPADQQRLRKREWNRDFLQDIFPRVPQHTLEHILDILISKNVVYNLSESKFWNMRRFTSIVVAHVRHNYSDYDKLLREKNVERYAARQTSALQVWKTLREWCPWEESNQVLERCFKATLLRPEERGADFDPMDIDEESDFEDDPMDLD
ncbi:hypothetical protein MRB53_038734 [Persea americana]|nr:hypothetical protein MRB53_038734 [Persea americana]